MVPTRMRLLILIAGAFAVIGWSLATVWESVAGRYLPLPWTASAAIWVLAAAMAMWAWSVKPRLRRSPGAPPLEPIVAARTAALALAASRVGAGVLGFYAGVAVMIFPDFEIAAARAGLAVCALTVVGSVALCAAALWLEWMCRIKGDDDSVGGSPADGAA